MGKRYYCDYCDRSFIDDLEARKKHLNGSMHMRLRKEHYDSIRGKLYVWHNTHSLFNFEKQDCEHISKCHQLKLPIWYRISLYAQLGIFILPDPKTLLAEESEKEPCKRFLHTGECVFGSNCRFTHFSRQQLHDVKRQSK